MARSSGIQFNEAFFTELSHSQGVKQLVDDAAERVLAAAQASAPVGETEAYKAGLHLESKLQKRYVALVVASDPKSMLIEAKTGNLARALRKAKKR